jgi:beta-galactosidase
MIHPPRDAQENVLAVMCDNRFMKDPAPEAVKSSGPAPDVNLGKLSEKANASMPEEVDQLQADQIPWNNPHWHPPHGGLYRNVFLHITDPLHISLPLYSFLQTAGPYVYATDISSNAAQIHLEVPIENGRSVSEKIDVVAQVLDRDGKTVLTLKQSGVAGAAGKTQFDLSGALNRPQLWEPDYPYLYRVTISLRVGGETVDTSEAPLGIRTVRWDVKTGFWINGHPL